MRENDLENHMVIGDYYERHEIKTIDVRGKINELQLAEHHKKIEKILKSMNLGKKWRDLYEI